MKQQQFVSFQVSAETARLASVVAAAEGVSRSEFLRQAISERIAERLPKVSEVVNAQQRGDKADEQ